MSSPEKERGQSPSIRSFVPVPVIPPPEIASHNAPGRNITDATSVELPAPLISRSVSSPQGERNERNSSRTFSSTRMTAVKVDSRRLDRLDTFTGGRIRLGGQSKSRRKAQSSGGEGEASTSRRRSSSRQIVGSDADTPATQSDIPSAKTQPDPMGSPEHHSLAKQNEVPLGVRKELSSNLNSWDAAVHQLRKLRTAFYDWNNRRTLKHITASLHVLRTYHDACLWGKVPLHVKAKSRLRSGLFGLLWHVLEFMLAVLSGALYVYTTYDSGTRFTWVNDVQNFISVAFFADYVLRIYSEPVRFYYFFSLWGLTDFLSMIPVVLIFRDDLQGGNIIRLLQFIRIVRILDLTNKLLHVGSSVTQQIILLTVATFGVIILDAGILQWLEYNTASASTQAKCPDEGCITFWQSFYFLIVTIATVGYGDVTAKTILGQAVVCLTILVAITMLPIRIAQITSLAFLRPYGGSLSGKKILGSRFLILSGGISLQGVQIFLAEFFKHTHRQEHEAYPLRVIIMGPFTPSFDLKQLVSLYQGSVEFIQGCSLHQDDLERVSAHKAMAIFLIAYREAENVKLEDSAQMMRALAVHRFCRGHGQAEDKIRVIVEVLDPATQRSAVWDEKYAGSIEVICPTKIHYKMMARCCFVKGLYTLITNLFTSELRLKHMDSRHFLTEYFHSFSNEVYPVILSSAFHGLPFEEAAEMVFLTFHSTLFALDTLIRTKSSGKVAREVLLYPHGQIIKPDDVGIVITNDLKTAFAMSKFESKEPDTGQQVGWSQKLWDRYMKTTPETTETSTEGIRLLHRMRRSISSSFRSRASVISIDSAPFGLQQTQVFPTGPDSEFGLESQMRSAIHDVYSSQEYPNWRGSLSGRRSMENKARDDSVSGIVDEIKTDFEFRFLKGMSLENAVEKLLSWPPVLKNEPPHPAVLERRADVILKNLKARTIAMVAFNKPHVLVCCQAGWPANLFYFLAQLRDPKFVNPPVVILHPKEPTSTQWGSVGLFKDIFFLKGSPKYELDLMRGGVIQAGKIVILADQGLPVDLGGTGVMDDRQSNKNPAAYTSDVENIVVAANVQRLCGDGTLEKIIVEMQHSNAFHYLRPPSQVSFSAFKAKDFKRNRDAVVYFEPPYMEGKAVSSTMLAFLLRSSFYNRNTLTIVEQLIRGGYIPSDDGLSSDRSRVLDLIEIPTLYASQPYNSLFLDLLRERAMLAIALYRVRGCLGAPTSYVLTNPSKDCILNPDDLVYVIR